MAFVVFEKITWIQKKNMVLNREAKDEMNTLEHICTSLNKYECFLSKEI